MPQSKRLAPASRAAGFAVVASEVRALAQRSASAAKEIKGLIGESVEKVRAGTGLADESAEALNAIMNSIKKVSGIVGEIATASKEQAAGIEQVNMALTKMDESTQQNAALVEEAAAAAKGMEHQSQQLITEVSYFRTEESGATRTTRVSRIVRSPQAAPKQTSRCRAQPERRDACNGSRAILGMSSVNFSQV